MTCKKSSDKFESRSIELKLVNQYVIETRPNSVPKSNQFLRYLTLNCKQFLNLYLTNLNVCQGQLL